MDRAELIARWRHARADHPAVVDAVLATSFLAIGINSTQGLPAADGGIPLVDEPLGVVLLLLATVPYYVRRRSPVAVFVVSSTAVLVLSGLEYQEGAIPLITLFGAFTVGARCPSRVVTASYVYVSIGLVVLYLSDTPRFDFANLASYVALFAASMLLGWNLQSRAARLEALEQRAEAVSREHEEEARRAVADERLRIAQELHDVVAHSMGVIAVQAGAGAHVIDTDPAEAKRALEAISATSRQSLTEIRRLLGVLRDDQGRTTEYAPAPGIDDLPRLAADVTDAGVDVDLRLDGAHDEIPGGLALTAYRIVQEALTNVMKHGGPRARAAVVITFRPGIIAITVTDDGRGIDLADQGPDGHGLRGMRERVGVYGGDLQAGPRSSGGYRVSATLPYGDPDSMRVNAAASA